MSFRLGKPRSVWVLTVKAALLSTLIWVSPSVGAADDATIYPCFVPGNNTCPEERDCVGSSADITGLCKVRCKNSSGVVIGEANCILPILEG